MPVALRLARERPVRFSIPGYPSIHRESVLSRRTDLIANARTIQLECISFYRDEISIMIRSGNDSIGLESARVHVKNEGKVRPHTERKD